MRELTSMPEGVWESNLLTESLRLSYARQEEKDFQAQKTERKMAPKHKAWCVLGTANSSVDPRAIFKWGRED